MNKYFKMLKKSDTSEGLKKLLSHIRQKLLIFEEESEAEINLIAPLTKEKVLEFEQKHHIKLPENYAQFIQNVCSGIEIDGEITLMNLENIEKYFLNDIILQKTFSYQTKEALILLSEMERRGEEFQDFYYSTENTIRKEGLQHGCIMLSDYGCNDYTVLIVNGEEYGKLWRVGEFDFPEHSHLYDFQQGNYQPFQYGFLEWFYYFSQIQGIDL
ncbi:MAG: hypothetical protein OHK0038_16610 [Flammeovirgaceae bacterium]